MLRLICMLSVVLSSYAVSVPFINKCKSGDPSCLRTSALAAVPYFARGVPELGIKPMDPLYLPLIRSNQGGLKIVFKDTTLTGLRHCSIENLKYDSTRMKQAITLKCSLVLTGNYTIDGQLLIIRTEGEGKYKIDIRDMLIKVGVDLATANDEESKPHWHITKWNHSFKVLTGTTFDFENLFNGNKILAQPVLDFANTNWKDVMQEIAPPIVEAIIGEVVNAVESLYKSVPIEDLYLN